MNNDSSLFCGFFYELYTVYIYIYSIYIKTFLKLLLTLLDIQLNYLFPPFFNK